LSLTSLLILRCVAESRFLRSSSGDAVSAGSAGWDVAEASMVSGGAVLSSTDGAIAAPDDETSEVLLSVIDSGFRVNGRLLERREHSLERLLLALHGLLLLLQQGGQLLDDLVHVSGPQSPHSRPWTM